MVRSCHVDTCPVGHRHAAARAAREVRRARPTMVEAYLLLVAEEVRRILAALGPPQLRRGVSDAPTCSQRARPAIGATRGARPRRRCWRALRQARHTGNRRRLRPERASASELGTRCRGRARGGRIVDLHYAITNTRSRRGRAARGRDRPPFRRAPSAGSRSRSLRGHSRAELRRVPRARASSSSWTARRTTTSARA